MKKLLILALLIPLFGCPSTPDKPLSVSEQQQMQFQYAINNSRLALQVFQVYIASKSDDWDAEKVAEYERLADTVKLAIDTWQSLLDENDLASVRSQEIIVQALIEGLEARQ